MIEHAERPWGSHAVLTEGDRFKVKTIEVRAGQHHLRRPGSLHLWSLGPRPLAWGYGSSLRMSVHTVS